MPVTINSSVPTPTATVTNSTISAIDSRVSAANGTVTVASGLRRRGVDSWYQWLKISDDTDEGADVVSTGGPIITDTVTNSCTARACGGY